MGSQTPALMMKTVLPLALAPVFCLGLSCAQEGFTDGTDESTALIPVNPSSYERKEWNENMIPDTPEVKQWDNYCAELKEIIEATCNVLDEIRDSHKVDECLPKLKDLQRKADELDGNIRRNTFLIPPERQRVLLVKKHKLMQSFERLFECQKRIQKHRFFNKPELLMAMRWGGPDDMTYVENYKKLQKELLDSRRSKRHQRQERSSKKVEEMPEEGGEE